MTATSDARWARFTGWVRAVAAWHARLAAQRLCGHHYHPDGFIDFTCCRCGHNRDGFPPPDRAECLHPGAP